MTAEVPGHPSPAELERFMLTRMSPRQAAPLVAHFLRGCPECRQRIAPLAALMFGEEPLLPRTIRASANRCSQCR